jgi:hypothetical protein
LDEVVRDVEIYQAEVCAIPQSETDADNANCMRLNISHYYTLFNRHVRFD